MIKISKHLNSVEISNFEAAEFLTIDMKDESNTEQLKNQKSRKARPMTYKKLYLGDNGSINCFDHLGITAQKTHHDLQGNQIIEIQTDLHHQFVSMGLTPRCECCGAYAALTVGNTQ